MPERVAASAQVDRAWRSPSRQEGARDVANMRITSRVSASEMGPASFDQDDSNALVIATAPPRAASSFGMVPASSGSTSATAGKIRGSETPYQRRASASQSAANGVTSLELPDVVGAARIGKAGPTTDRSRLISSSTDTSD